MVHKKNIKLVYDDQCPLCRTYCKNIQVNDDVKLSLIDARKESEVMDHVTQEGFDIDEGMVLYIDDNLYYGYEAMHEIATLSQEQGWLLWINRYVFNSQKKSKFFYSIGKAIRNMVFRVLDIEDIHNLKPKHTLKSQLGDSWYRLHPNIQERFNKEPKLGETLTYSGEMLEMRRSFTRNS